MFALGSSSFFKEQSNVKLGFLDVSQGKRAEATTFQQAYFGEGKEINMCDKPTLHNPCVLTVVLPPPPLF